MAGEFLRSHGIDIDAEMARIQAISSMADPFADRGETVARPLESIFNASLHGKPAGTTWDVSMARGQITSIQQHFFDNQKSHQHSRAVDAKGALLAPAFCHPHVHLDKAYLLSHPKYADLQIERGDFAEAMELTGKAKSQFEEWDLLERGQRLIDESVQAGVTHMRAFVEVDAGVGTKCLDAGIKLKLKAEAEGRCSVQLCAFAQLPLFTSTQGDDGGVEIRRLMSAAAAKPEVDVIGSTPYVEKTRNEMERNIDWMVELSVEHNLHLDFHLDYNLDPKTEAMVWHVVKTLKERKWSERTLSKTVVLGHCTRLTLFEDDDWSRLKQEIGELPISFVGLPTSDLFMMRTPDRTRGTLDVLKLIKQFDLNACLGINNIGNAFTPQGSCDPLTLACNGVGIYHAGTKKDAELLYECVSVRARQAIGMGYSSGRNGADGTLLEPQIGDEADLVLFAIEHEMWRNKRSVSEAVYLYDHCRGRRLCQRV